MKRAIITVGLGFGDEGKGATVDFLTRYYDADLVVRYCGGSQAGHNVQLPGGARHTFSQFGAGTLATTSRPCRTYLGPNVVIDPPALWREAEHLAELGVHEPAGLITVHPRCLVTTIWHVMINRMRELARGADRHGSCGAGIGEARSYWLEHGQDAVFAADLRDWHVLRQKVELLRQRALLKVQDLVSRMSGDQLRELDLWGLDTESVAGQLSESLEKGVMLSAAVPECRTAVFEGAQGVLLDEYRGFHPHTTWSTVTAHHAWELVRQMEVDAVAVLGVTRAYTTRHGEGPLPTYSAALTARLRDPGNPDNPWQGSLRCGWLDMPLLRYAAQAAGALDGIVVNHLDQVGADEWFVCDAYRNASLSPAEAPNLAWQSQLTRQLGEAGAAFTPATGDEIIGRLEEVAPVVLTGHGATHEGRRFSGLKFRGRRVPLAKSGHDALTQSRSPGHLTAGHETCIPFRQGDLVCPHAVMHA
jgi:adenylosuccinate synthase